MKADPYSVAEIEELRNRVRSGGDPMCPRCGGTLQRRDIPPRDDVSYVRNRRWLVCVPCRLSGVLDLPGKGDRSP